MGSNIFATSTPFIVLGTFLGFPFVTSNKSTLQKFINGYCWTVTILDITLWTVLLLIRLNTIKFGFSSFVEITLDALCSASTLHYQIITLDALCSASILYYLSLIHIQMCIRDRVWLGALTFSGANYLDILMLRN